MQIFILLCNHKYYLPPHPLASAIFHIWVFESQSVSKQDTHIDVSIIYYLPKRVSYSCRMNGNVCGHRVQYSHNIYSVTAFIRVFQKWVPLKTTSSPCRESDDWFSLCCSLPVFRPLRKVNCWPFELKPPTFWGYFRDLKGKRISSSLVIKKEMTGRQESYMNGCLCASPGRWAGFF